MTDEIEELWKLADECRERAREEARRWPNNASDEDKRVAVEFTRLAAELERIAGALADNGRAVPARMPT